MTSRIKNASNYGLILILGVVLNSGLRANSWRASWEKFSGETEDNIIWKAGYRHRNDEPEDPFMYTVERAYGKAILPPKKSTSKILARLAIRLSEHKQGYLRLEIPSNHHSKSEKDKARSKIFRIVLRINDTLKIERTYRFPDRSHVISIADSRIFENQLRYIANREARKISIAILHKDKDEADNSEIVRLAVWLLTSEKPLGKKRRRIMLLPSYAMANGKKIALKTRIKSDGRRDFRIRAHIKDTILLFPRFQILEYLVYASKIRIKRKPLPAYAFVKLADLDGNFLAFGKPAASPGKFKIGPLFVRSLRKIKLTVYYGKEPPGNKPRSLSYVYFRNGRKIEKYLDQGRLPAPSRTAKYTRLADIPGAAARDALSRFNPDIGEIHGLSNRHLADLYVYAYKTILRRPGLASVLKEALVRDHMRSRWVFQARSFSEPYGWQLQDALRVLQYPSLLSSFAKRVQTSPQPEVSGTSNDLFVQQQAAKGYTEAAYALAVAALSPSSKKKIRILNRKQLQRLRQGMSQNPPASWDLKYLLLAGQALKYASRLSRDPGNRNQARILSYRIRREARDRYNGKIIAGKRIPLHIRHKSEIAHMLSPIWRPYLGVPASMQAGTDGMEPINEKRTGLSELVEIRLRFKSAIRAALEDVLNLSVSRKEKRSRIERLVQRWYQYLIRVNRGTLPPVIRTAVKKERETAFAAIGK